MAKTITITINKGGAGKTVTAVNLAVLMGMEGYKVLVVDMDPSTNATFYLTGESLTGNAFKNRGVSDMIRYYGGKMPCEFCLPTAYQNVDIMPANAQQDNIDSVIEYFVKSENISPNAVLQYCLRDLQELYDYIVIDTPPSNTLIEKISLVAADGIIIPCRLDATYVEGALKTYGVCENLMKAEQKNIALLGILKTCVERNAVSKYVSEELLEKGDFSKDVFSSFIRKGVQVVNCSVAAIPVVVGDPKSNPSVDYRNFYQELKIRMQNLMEEK